MPTTTTTTGGWHASTIVSPIEVERMMNRRRRTNVLLLLLSLFPSPTSAWGIVTHAVPGPNLSWRQGCCYLRRHPASSSLRATIREEASDDGRLCVGNNTGLVGSQVNRPLKAFAAAAMIAGAALVGLSTSSSAAMTANAAAASPMVEHHILVESKQEEEMARLPQPREHSWTSALRPSPSAISSSTTTILSSSAKEEHQTSVLDEVWTLIDKFYVDKTKNTNWSELKSKYQVRFDKARDDAARFAVVSDMVDSLGDKYSRMLDASQYAAIQRFDLIGVGVTLMPNEAKEITVGAPPIPGSAADQAGLKVGDLITKVNGVTTSGKTAFDIIDQITENPNAGTVTMTVLPAADAANNDVSASTPTTYDVTMERTLQTVQNPIRYKLNDDGNRKVGFIRIGEFNSLVISKLEDALAELQKGGAQAYVLDLRQNTGGAFQSAVEISSLFISDKIATYVVDNGAQKMPFKTAKNELKLDTDVPIVLWIDGRSASASEVLAGSLHDNCRAVLMGSNSFGKGLIQAVYGLKNGAGLVLTVARYVTPAGVDIQGSGIAPDIAGHVPLSLPGIALGTDTSQIDFDEIQQLLRMCQVPSPLS